MNDRQGSGIATGEGKKRLAWPDEGCKLELPLEPELLRTSIMHHADNTAVSSL